MVSSKAVELVIDSRVVQRDIVNLRIGEMQVLDGTVSSVHCVQALLTLPGQEDTQAMCLLPDNEYSSACTLDGGVGLPLVRRIHAIQYGFPV